MGDNFPGGKPKREERGDIMPLGGREGFLSKGVKINLQLWHLFMLSHIQLHKCDIIEHLSNVCNHITACYTPIYVTKI